MTVAAGRVCMVVHHYFPRDVRVRREARALAAAGYDVTVVCLRLPGQPARERWEGIEIVRQPMMRHRGRPLLVYLAEYLAMTALAGVAVAGLHRGRPFDVVHVHAPPDFLVGAGLLAGLTGARLVLDVHDLTPELYGSRFGGLGSRGARRLAGLVEQGACGLADRVVTVTDVFGRRLVERGLDPDRLVVIRNCPDEEVFTPSGDGGTRSSDGLRVVLHGTLMRRYGVDVLLEAFAIVVRGRPGARLDVYGEGDLAPLLERMAAVPPLAGRVTLHGDVPQETLAGELQSADLCVVPNRSDPFTDLLLPTKLLEALRMGCATIASATPVIRETFGQGEVELVTPGDPRALAAAIERLAADNRARQRLADRGMRAAERFSWEREKEKLLGMYSELITRSSRRRRRRRRRPFQGHPGAPAVPH